MNPTLKRNTKKPEKVLRSEWWHLGERADRGIREAEEQLGRGAYWQGGGLYSRKAIRPNNKQTNKK